MVREYLGISTFHITDDPMHANSNLHDPSFHIDCSAKFLDVDKILIAQVPPDNSQYDECEAVAGYWANHPFIGAPDPHRFTVGAMPEGPDDPVESGS